MPYHFFLNTYMLSNSIQRVAISQSWFLRGGIKSVELWVCICLCCVYTKALLIDQHWGPLLRRNVIRNVVAAGKATFEVHTKECLGSVDNNINDLSYEGNSIRWTTKAKLLKIGYSHSFLTVAVSFINSNTLKTFQKYMTWSFKV